jgi:hypothetical protein
MAHNRAFKTAVQVEVNHHILEAAHDSVSEGEEWEFFCECGRAACTEHVVLTVEAFVALQTDGGAVLAPRHRLTREERLRRAEHARRTAKRLREEARALSAQAELQQKRASKNRRSPETRA